MDLTKKCIICVVLIIIAGIIAVNSCSSQAGGTKDSISAGPKGDPVKIGICMPSKGPLAARAAVQADGIRAAAQFARTVDGRPIEVVFKDSGSTVQDFRKVVEELVGKDRVSAVIACIHPETASAGQDFLKSGQIPLILTAPSSPGRKSEEDPNVVNIATTLEDQAFASARFASDTLRARRFGIILDVTDEMSVRLASLFSSNVVKNSGSIVDIAYLTKQEEPSDGLSRLLGKKPDALYIPYSPVITSGLITAVRGKDMKIPILVSNSQMEDEFLAFPGGPFDRVYLLTDFHEQAVQSTRGRNFIDFYHNTLNKKGFLSSGIAIGADAYFLAVDITINTRPADGQKPERRDIDWSASMLRIMGVRSSGAVRDQLSIGLVNKVFLHGPTFKYLGQVLVLDLKPAADVRTQ